MKVIKKPTVLLNDLKFSELTMNQEAAIRGGEEPILPCRDKCSSPVSNCWSANDHPKAGVCYNKCGY